MRCNVILVVTMIQVCGALAHTQAPSFGLGRTPTENELTPPYATIGPEGQGLPPGSGTAAQGAVLFIGRGCSICHGPTGAEGPGPHLTGTHTYSMRGTGSGYDALYEGGNFQGRGIKNFFAAPLVWSFINKAMPLQRQGHLTMDEVYSLTAYLLYRNGIIQEDDVMDANSLPRVQLPGRDTYAYSPQHPAWSNWKPGLPKKVSK